MELPDPRNADILISVNGELKPRSEAKVSVFDSSVQGGDAVWEGLRVYRGRIADLDRHLDRLFGSAHAMAFSGVPARETVRAALFETLRANGMTDGVHVRLTLSRGEKVTSGMKPRMEPDRLHAHRVGRVEAAGLRPRGHPPDHLLDSPEQPAVHRLEDSPRQPDQQHPCQDPRPISLAWTTLSCWISDGFVAETNATNVFLIRNRRDSYAAPPTTACPESPGQP